MKNFKEYLEEHNHWAALRRALEIQTGATQFSPQAAALWSDYVSTLSDAEFMDMLAYQRKTGNIVIPDEFDARIRKIGKQIDSAIAVAGSSARTPKQRASVIRRILRSVGRIL